MADRVKGIKIEIDGDTQGLDKALKSVNDKSVKLNKELKDVNKLLKFDPGNAELVAQKQKLLSDQVENTKTKLNALKQAQSQVEQQFQSGKIGEEQYRNFQREVASTEQSLRSYESQLKNLESSQTALGQNTKRLETFFEASKTSVDDYADILGNKLTQAIKGGYANADQLEVAINKIGREFTDSKSDIAEFKNALDGIDSGSSIDEIRSDLEQLRPSADEASASMDDLAESVTQGNMMQAGEIISGLGDKIVDLGGKAVEASLQYQQALGVLKANTTLSKQELEQLGGVAQNVFKSGVTDSIDEATQATALMKQSFGDLDNQQLTQLTEQVITLSQRTGTGVNENVRAASKLMQAFGMDAQSAFDYIAKGYQNGLNKSGDYLDTVDEYSIHFKESGYTAQEMFSIIDNGMKNGAQNTDKVADSIKELKNKLGDGSFEKVMGSFSQNTQDAFNKWKENKATVKDVAASIQNDLKNMSPEQQQQALSQLSTQFEDLGIQATSSLFDIEGGFDDVKGAMDSATESDPSQEWQSTWNEFAASMQQIGTDVLTALQPVLDFVSKMMEAFGNLPAPVRIFIEVIAGLMGVFALLAPIIASIISIVSALAPIFSAIAGVVGTVAGVLSGPLILGIAAAIGAIVGIIAVITNWSTIWNWIQGVIAAFSAWFNATWQSISAWFSSVLSAISSTASSVWNGILSTIQSIVNGISNVISNVWNTIKSVTSSVWNGIKSAIEGPINTAKDAVSRGINAIKNLFNFKISWPHIPLPHFKISGSANPLDWIKHGVPKIGIDWYAKGGILTRPTVFGMNGNSLMVGGEAGKEAVAPLSDLMDYVRQAVAEQNQESLLMFNQMIELLAIIAQKDNNIYVDGDNLTNVLSKRMNDLKNKKANQQGYRSVVF